MKTIINQVTILLSAVCPPSNPGEVIFLCNFDENYYRHSFIISCMSALQPWGGYGAGGRGGNWGMARPPIQGDTRLRYFNLSTPRFALFSCQNIVFCAIFFFWKIRPKMVMERPPVQVDTRLR